jgi:hypothetical protein
MQPASDNRFPSPHPSPALMGAPAFYCTGEDNLQITTVDSNFPLSYTTRLRFLETSGQVNVYEFNTISLGSRLAHSSSFRLGEGWILNCDVVITGAGAQPAQSFIRVSVIRGLSGGTIEVATLVQGFANSIQRLAWPGSPIVTTIGQPGIIRTFTGTDPAAGAEMCPSPAVGALSPASRRLLPVRPSPTDRRG